MGPMKNLSAMANEVRCQASEVMSLVYRMRDANKRLTGNTGELPTNRVEAGAPVGMPPEANPLLVDLTVAIEHLNGATADLRAEINYFETMVAETGVSPSSPPSAPSALGELRLAR